MAMMLQNFDMEKEDPNYKLKIKQVLSIKPDGFRVRLTPRKSRNLAVLRKSPQNPSTPAPSTHVNGFKPIQQPNGRELLPITVVYGSNTGTCEALAHQLALNAPVKGFQAKTVAEMNAVKGKLHKDQVVIIIAASYNGHPSDNAYEFVSWLTGLNEGALEGVSYSVFGVGECGSSVPSFHCTCQKLTEFVQDTLIGPRHTCKCRRMLMA
jgi:cytochrome P450/NADPH-cytochrome P450 reductase